MMFSFVDFLFEVFIFPVWISLFNGVSILLGLCNRSRIRILKSVTKFYKGDNMKMTMGKIRQLMGEAFKAGNVNCCDVEEECINEILSKHDGDGADSFIEEEARVYTADELKQLPEGTKFHHSSLGDCTIAIKKDQKHMVFADTDLGPAGFKVDSYPWDQPMKRLAS
jgi:hypothetical protein